LPLTLAIIDGFLVTVGTATFVVPLTALPNALPCRKTGKPPAAGQFNLRGEVLPLLCLRRFHGLEGK
jgi:two-component system chemotaxis sensor kinase CheA